MTPAIAHTVGQVLTAAERPLTVDEILARVEELQPIASAQPRAAIRNAFVGQPLIASLGGRPARYVWWPNMLAGSSFRMSLTAADPAAGPWPLDEEVFQAFWPTFFSERLLAPHAVTLVLPDGSTEEAQIGFVRPEPAAWALIPGPALTAWLRQQGPAAGAALIVRVRDVAGRRYAVELVQPDQRDEPALAARNRALTAAAAEVLVAGHPDMPDFYLAPRLIARGAYYDPLPPDPFAAVLAADMGFIVRNRGYNLVAKLVDAAERQIGAAISSGGAPRPAGPRWRAETESERRAWAEYLFDQGMECLWAGWRLEAEAYYREALCLDAGHADAWVHLGNIYVEGGQITTALACYERGEAAALARTIGDPARYAGPFWLDLDSRPYLRALHGKGCCYWRLGRTAEARRVFAHMLRLNPNDNQGARYLLAGLDAGRTWEEEAAWEDREWGKPA
jgi:tetratricopeptide (TPR) repeat protein